MKKITRWISWGIHLALAVFFLWYGAFSYQKAGELEKNITILLAENGLSVSEVQKMAASLEVDEVEETTNFTAWTEEKQARINDQTTGRTVVVNTLLIHGSSELLLPYGRILHSEDTQGCLIGAGIAEKLFGTHDAIGFTLCYNGTEFVVRGVITTPENLLVVQAGAFQVVEFDHITMRRSGKLQIKQAAEKFLAKYNLAGQLLRFDYYLDQSWLEELIPGKWSDLDGWKEKIALKKQDFSLLSTTSKSTIEMTYWTRCQNGRWSTILGIVLLLWLMVLPIIKYKHQSKKY